MLPPHKRRIFIVDDHFLIPEGVASLLATESQFEIVGTSNNPTEVVNQLKQTPADILITDVSMPGMSGIELTAAVLKQYPKMRVLALSALCEPATTRLMISAGVSGYVLKDDGKDALIAAIKTVAGGGRYFSDDIQRVMESDRDFIRFTTRETEIIKLIAKEYNSREIADHLGISERTVESHRSNLLRKVATANTAGLLQYAYQKGVL